MKILAINCGSSTLKFQFISMEGEATAPGRKPSLAHGIIEGIGGQGSIEFTTKDGQHIKEAVAGMDHGEATRRVLSWLDSIGLLEQRVLDAVGHRVVHGGERFVDPTLIDDDVIEALEAISGLAPLHNKPSLNAIRAARAELGPAVPMVARK